MKTKRIGLLLIVPLLLAALVAVASAHIGVGDTEQLVAGFEVDHDQTAGTHGLNGEDWNTVISSSQGYRNTLLVLLALGVLLPTLIVGVGVRRITRPIRDLTRGAQRIAGGDFDYSIQAETGDELQDLARQFLDEVGHVMSRKRQSPGLHHLRIEKAPEAYL